jgi:hypothetical protein
MLEGRPAAGAYLATSFTLRTISSSPGRHAQAAARFLMGRVADRPGLPAGRVPGHIAANSSHAHIPSPAAACAPCVGMTVVVMFAETAVMTRSRSDNPIAQYSQYACIH